MADQATILSRLATRTGRSNDELNTWLTEAITQLGYATVADVPDGHVEALLSYTEYVGYNSLAAQNAESASLSVKGISINKTNVSGNLAKVAKEAYRRFVVLATKAGVKIPTGASVVCSTVARNDGR